MMDIKNGWAKWHEKADIEVARLKKLRRGFGRRFNDGAENPMLQIKVVGFTPVIKALDNFEFKEVWLPWLKTTASQHAQEQDWSTKRERERMVMDVWHRKVSNINNYSMINPRFINDLEVFIKQIPKEWLEILVYAPVPFKINQEQDITCFPAGFIFKKIFEETSANLMIESIFLGGGPVFNKTKGNGEVSKHRFIPMNAYDAISVIVSQPEMTGAPVLKESFELLKEEEEFNQRVYGGASSLVATPFRTRFDIMSNKNMDMVTSIASNEVMSFKYAAHPLNVLDLLGRDLGKEELQTPLMDILKEDLLPLIRKTEKVLELMNTDGFKKEVLSNRKMWEEWRFDFINHIETELNWGLESDFVKAIDSRISSLLLEGQVNDLGIKRNKIKPKVM